MVRSVGLDQDMSHGFCQRFVGSIVSSWGNDMSLDMVKPVLDSCSSSSESPQILVLKIVSLGLQVDKLDLLWAIQELRGCIKQL